MTDEILEKLEDLLAEDQFELIGVEDTQGEMDREGDFRLVYLMNDAVESFLVFQKAKLTGDYQRDYQGSLGAELEKNHTGYVLSVYQGENVCSLFFEDLILENHFYNYGQVGHCWVKGFENIRVLEYQIAILRDKLDFLGEDSCNELEKKLAMLRDFPPLNQSCYPAVPAKYLVERDDKWNLTKDAAKVMRELALEAGDRSLVEKLDQYESQQEGSWASKYWQSRTRTMARLFQKPEHQNVLKLIADKIKEATKDYPRRKFGDDETELYTRLQEKAQKRAEELRLQESKVIIYRQEPFFYARDSIEFQVFLIILDREGNIRTEIIEK